jgi:hypothetical protein
VQGQAPALLPSPLGARSEGSPEPGEGKCGSWKGRLGRNPPSPGGHAAGDAEARPVPPGRRYHREGISFRPTRSYQASRP